MAQHDYFFLAERAAKVIGQLDSVLCDSVECDLRRLLAIATVGVAGTTLVPLNDGELLLPGPIHFSLRPLRLARSAVNHQQHRIAAILALDADPLIDAADRNQRRLVDAGVRVFGHDCQWSNLIMPGSR